MGLLFYKWFVASWMFIHPFYVSVTEIQHDKATGELQVSCRIFTDDLENVLKKDNKTNVDITHPANQQQVNGFIAAYIKKHLAIKVDGQWMTLNYMGYKIEEEAAWCFLSANTKTCKQVHVKDDILYTEHPNQINMVHVIVNGDRKSTKLDNPKAEMDESF
jgi:hypothetical protein